VAASEGSRRGNNKHGIELQFTSKFWASGDSSSDSEEDDGPTERVSDLSSPMLVSEALMVGVSMDQIMQAENELESPPSSTSQVCDEHMQGLISRKIVDVWIENYKGKVHPWIGPLPTPHRSPLCTFGDFLAKAKVVESPNEHKWGSGMGSR
jgi:hypothetical protein